MWTVWIITVVIISLTPLKNMSTCYSASLFTTEVLKQCPCLMESQSYLPPARFLPARVWQVLEINYNRNLRQQSPTIYWLLHISQMLTLATILWSWSTKISCCRTDSHNACLGCTEPTWYYNINEVYGYTFLSHDRQIKSRYCGVVGKFFTSALGDL